MSSPGRIQALTMEEDIEGQGTTICQLLLPLRLNDGMSSTFFNALSIKKKRFNAHLVCAFIERCKKTTPFSSILPHKGGGNLWTGLYEGDDEEWTGHSSLSCSRSHG